MQINQPGFLSNCKCKHCLQFKWKTTRFILFAVFVSVTASRLLRPIKPRKWRNSWTLCWRNGTQNHGKSSPVWNWSLVRSPGWSGSTACPQKPLMRQSKPSRSKVIGLSSRSACYPGPAPGASPEWSGGLPLRPKRTKSGWQAGRTWSLRFPVTWRLSQRMRKRWIASCTATTGCRETVAGWSILLAILRHWFQGHQQKNKILIDLAHTFLLIFKALNFGIWGWAGGLWLVAVKPEQLTIQLDFAAQKFYA